jgi:hypothetical protein
MEALSLVKTVNNILNRRVTEEEAKQFALDNFGILCSHIRAEHVKEILLARDPKYQTKLDVKTKAQRILMKRNKDG